MHYTLEGKNPVLEALRAGRPLQRVLVERGYKTDAQIRQIIQLCRELGVTLQFVTDEEIVKESLTGRHQGVMAFAAGRKYVEVQDILLRAKEREEPALILALDGLEDPHNLGAIIRSGEAAGVHGIVIPEHRSVGINSTVARISMGAIEHMLVAQVNNIYNALRECKEAGLWSYALDHNADKLLYEADLADPVILIVGSEGKGVSRTILKHCDGKIRLPMNGKVNSLNASVAAALAVYEAVRQRLIIE